jgi:hypothetical protein
MKTTPAKPSRPATPRRRRRTKADCALAHRLIALLHEGQDIRMRKTRRTRAAIKVRSYENDLKLQVAIERLIDELSPV